MVFETTHNSALHSPASPFFCSSLCLQFLEPSAQVPAAAVEAWLLQSLTHSPVPTTLKFHSYHVDMHTSVHTLLEVFLSSQMISTEHTMDFIHTQPVLHSMAEYSGPILISYSLAHKWIYMRSINIWVPSYRPIKMPFYTCLNMNFRKGASETTKYWQELWKTFFWHQRWCTDLHSVSEGQLNKTNPKH